MKSVRTRIRNQRGFTLVELMTVVAIIGVLASVGVPQYRKIQRKAKRAEATLALGVIASAEAAFYAEYVGYGSNMGGIGAELENAPKSYNVGFLTLGIPERGTVAADGTVTANTIKFCELNTGCGKDNPATFTGYRAASINSPTVVSSGTGSALVYDVNTSNKQPATGFQAILTVSGGSIREMNVTNALFGGLAGDAHGTSDFTSTGYPTAKQSGIYCGADNSNCKYQVLAVGNLYGRKGDDVKMDIISIDQQRVLIQVQDGT